jgi:hypothetical protein
MKTYIDFLLEIYRVKNERPSPQRSLALDYLDIVLKSVELSLNYQKSNMVTDLETASPVVEVLSYFFGTSDMMENENTVSVLRIKLNEIKSKGNVLNPSL